MIVRVSSEDSDSIGIEVSDNDEKDRSRNFVNCVTFLAVFDKVSIVLRA
jgi:hypothetical protein